MQESKRHRPDSHLVQRQKMALPSLWALILLDVCSCTSKGKPDKHTKLRAYPEISDGPLQVKLMEVLLLVLTLV